MIDRRTIVVIAALLLAVSTAFGAFGAHALKATLAPDRLAVYETGVRYMFFHTLGLLGVGLAADDLIGARARSIIAMLLLAGMLLFSGSILWLTFGAPRALGVVTPMGGILLMAAWFGFAVAVFRSKR